VRLARRAFSGAVGSARAGKDVDESTSTPCREVDVAVGFREECVVLAETDIDAGVKVRAALANDDRTRAHRLTV